MNFKQSCNDWCMSKVNLSGSRFGVTEFLNRPLSTFGCVLGWVIASVVFLGVTAWIGGPVPGDAALSVFTTWAIAHGHIACSYPTLDGAVFPPDPTQCIPPPALPTSFSGYFSINSRSTYNVPFPSSAHLGNHCLTASGAMFNWAVKARAIMPTIRISLPDLDCVARRSGWTDACFRSRPEWMGTGDVMFLSGLRSSKRVLDRVFPSRKTFWRWDLLSVRWPAHSGDDGRGLAYW